MGGSCGGVARRVAPVGVIILTALGLFLASSSAVASHNHTVGEWAHGLGDATDNDSYVHPYNHDVAGKAHHNEVDLTHLESGANIADDYNECNCRHNHIYWDTTGHRECKYSSNNWATAASSAASMNPHIHHHHNYCP